MTQESDSKKSDPKNSEPRTDDAAMIQTDGLTKLYGDFAAVADVTFSVPNNQVCAFLGPNGAGKSTTMKLLTGYLAPTRGQVSIAGYSLESDRIAASSTIGYLPENGPLYTEMTPKSALNFLAKVRGMSQSLKSDRMDFVCEKCDLKEVWNKPIGKLSRGFRQRVGMAQALLHDPQILILDEPTSGLDPNQLVGVRQLIRDLGETKTVLLSTHILREVELVCSRVIVINEGRLVYDGPIDEFNSSQGSEKQFHELTSFSN